MFTTNLGRWLVAATAVLTLSQCKKNEAAPQLPPETMTGAMTFGCEIDGRVFIPRHGKGQPGLYSEYLNLGLVRGGGYVLNIPATDWQKWKA